MLDSLRERILAELVDETVSEEDVAYNRGVRDAAALVTDAHDAGPELAKQVAELRKALEPFANAVYNDNGNIVVGSVHDRAKHCEHAYWVLRRLDHRSALAKAGQPPAPQEDEVRK